MKKTIGTSRLRGRPPLSGRATNSRTTAIVRSLPCNRPPLACRHRHLGLNGSPPQHLRVINGEQRDQSINGVLGRDFRADKPGERRPAGSARPEGTQGQRRVVAGEVSATGGRSRFLAARASARAFAEPTRGCCRTLSAETARPSVFHWRSLCRTARSRNSGSTSDTAGDGLSSLADSTAVFLGCTRLASPVWRGHVPAGSVTAWTGGSPAQAANQIEGNGHLGHVNCTSSVWIFSDGWVDINTLTEQASRGRKGFGHHTGRR